MTLDPKESPLAGVKLDEYAKPKPGMSHPTVALEVPTNILFDSQKRADFDQALKGHFEEHGLSPRPDRVMYKGADGRPINREATPQQIDYAVNATSEINPVRREYALGTPEAEKAMDRSNGRYRTDSTQGKVIVHEGEELMRSGKVKIRYRLEPSSAAHEERLAEAVNAKLGFLEGSSRAHFDALELTEQELRHLQGRSAVQLAESGLSKAAIELVPNLTPHLSNKNIALGQEVVQPVSKRLLASAEKAAEALGKIVGKVHGV